MILNILLSTIILYLFSCLFVFIDDRIDDLYYFIKTKLNKNQPKKNIWLRNKYLSIYRFFLHITEFPKDFYLESKWFIQRGIRGYSDRDIWNFDYYLSNIITKGIKFFKSQGHGLPTWTAEKSEEEALNEWNEILNSIIWTFETTEKENKHIMTQEEIETDNFFYQRFMRKQ